MSPSDLRKQINEKIDVLSKERWRVVDDFLAFLLDRESEEATEELLRIPGILKELERAEAEVKHGELTPVDDLRRRRSA